MSMKRLPPSNDVGMIPYSESAAIGAPPVNSVAGSIRNAWRTLLAPEWSPRNQRPSQ